MGKVSKKTIHMYIKKINQFKLISRLTDKMIHDFPSFFRRHSLSLSSVFPSLPSLHYSSLSFVFSLISFFVYFMYTHSLPAFQIPSISKSPSPHQSFLPPIKTKKLFIKKNIARKFQKILCQMTMSNHNRMMSFNNANIRKYEDKTERNNGTLGTSTDNAAFESWACESFNLFEFLGEDTSPLDEVVPEKDDDEIEKQKEDAMYSQFQYSDMLIGDHQHSSNSQNDFCVSEFVRVPSDVCSDFDVPNAFQSGVSAPEDFINAGVSFPMLPMANRMYSRDLNATATLHVPSTSKSSLPIIKQEPICEQEQNIVRLCLETSKSRESSVTSGPIRLKVEEDAQSPVSALRPRKYRIKPEAEKQNPLYRIKRQKNNDAVRRSRDKAKRIQEAKESEMKLLQDDNCRKAELIETLKASNARLQGENLLLRQNCRCGAAVQLAKR